MEGKREERKENPFGDPNERDEVMPTPEENQVAMTSLQELFNTLRQNKSMTKREVDLSNQFIRLKRQLLSKPI